MASIKDVEQVADDLATLVDQLRSELRGDNPNFDRLVQLADQISEHADETAGTFSTVNEVLMGRLNDIKDDGTSDKGKSRSTSSTGSRAKATA